jgi:SNF2 family DNA or RNA helicase
MIDIDEKGGRPAMVVHTFWQSESFVMSFWLENDAKRTPDPRQSPPFHPYDTGFDDLESRLPESLDLYSEVRLAHLPGYGGVGLKSTDPMPDGAGLHSWSVTCGESIADCAIDYLLSIDVGDDDGLILGASTGYWQQVLEFALWLFDMKWYMPGIGRLEQKYYPMWRAVFPTQIDAHWERLVDAMPPVCRAMAPPGVSAAYLVRTFLDAAIDYLVRRRILRRNPSFSSRPKKLPPPHKQWVDHLKRGHLSPIRGEAAAVNRFSANVLNWNHCLRPYQVDAEFRNGFSLRAPVVEDGPWFVHFFLRSVRNPGVSIVAEHLWDERRVANEMCPGVHQAFLRGLARACQLFPQLHDAADCPMPTECLLTRQQAYEFMTVIAPELKLWGYFVDLPDWLDRPESTIGLRLSMKKVAKPEPDRIAFLGSDQLMRFEWSVAIGTQIIEADELRELAGRGESLVFRGGKWIRLNVERLRETVRTLDKSGTVGDAQLAEIVNFGLTHETDGGLAVIDIHVEDSTADVFQRLNENTVYTEGQLPDGFHGELRPYQVTGYSWMHYLQSLGFGACLADDMGLGKTVQMIALLLRIHDGKSSQGPSLIVCPMSVVGNWYMELRRFGPRLKVMIHHGLDRDGAAQFAESAGKHDVIITTYSLVVRDQLIFLQRRWNAFILDEAQNIKNPNTKQAIAIRSLKSRSRFCLTGTPLENRLAELWSIMEFLNPGYLGKLASFRNNFALPIERENDSTRAQLLRMMIGPFILRRLKSDSTIIKDLPVKLEMKVYCNLTPEQAVLYQRTVDEMLSRLDGETGMARRGLVLSTLMKLKQITNHPSHFLAEKESFLSSRSGKLQRLEEMLEVILAEGDKALVFTQFTEFGKMLHHKLQEKFGVEVLFMHGGSSQSKRDEMVRRFQRAGGPPIFLLSLKAGGFGLNLTAANHVFHYDRWWNPAVEDQATDRAYRIGQTRNVQVHKLICIGTVEEKIDQMIENKKSLADNIISASENKLTELSTEELRKVFTLSRDAVSE